MPPPTPLPLAPATVSVPLLATQVTEDAAPPGANPVSFPQPQPGAPLTMSQPSQSPTPSPVTAGTPPSFEVVHRSHIPTLLHIPKSVRTDCARSLDKHLSKINENPSHLTNYILLHMWAKVILFAGKKGKDKDETLSAKIKTRLQRWERGDFEGLWNDALSSQNAPRKKSKKVKPETQQENNIRRCKRFAQEGQFRKASQALTSAGLADQTADTITVLKELHPQCPLAPPPCGQPSSPPLQFTKDHVLSAL